MMLSNSSWFSLSFTSLALMGGTQHRGVEGWVSPLPQTPKISTDQWHSFRAPHRPSRAPTSLLQAHPNPLSTDQLTAMGVTERNIRAQVGFRDGLTAQQLLNPTELGWCACENATPQLRVDFINTLVEIAEEMLDQKSELTLTNIGSGRLLQDFLVVQQLLTLNKNLDRLTINLIDPFYDCDIVGTYKSPTIKQADQPNTDTEAQYNVENTSDGLCSTDLLAVSQEVYDGFTLSIEQFLQKIHLLNSSDQPVEIIIHVMNSADCLTSLTALQEEPNHLISLTDPGEPALASVDHAHFIGVGSDEALPHQERLLCFFDNASKNDTEKSVGHFYLKSNVYDEVDPKDWRLVESILQLKEPTKAQILETLKAPGEEIHGYEDATVDFYDTIKQYPKAHPAKLAYKKMETDPLLHETASKPSDQQLQESGSMLGKKLTYGYRVIEFSYIDDER